MECLSVELARAARSDRTPPAQARRMRAVDGSPFPRATVVGAGYLDEPPRPRLLLYPEPRPEPEL
jgi:hypothetical protein